MKIFNNGEFIEVRDLTVNDCRQLIRFNQLTGTNNDFEILHESGISSKELGFLIGVPNSKNDSMTCLKLFESLRRFRMDHMNVSVIDNLTHESGSRTYLGYFKNNPIESVTVRMVQNNKRSRLASFMKFKDYEVFFYTLDFPCNPGVLAYVHNTGMTEKEFDEFTSDLFRKLSDSDQMLEGDSTLIKGEYLEWDSPEYFEIKIKIDRMKRERWNSDIYKFIRSN